MVLGWKARSDLRGAASPVNALEGDPREAKTYYLLAQARFNGGDLQNAGAAIRGALKLNPRQSDFQQLRDRIEEASAASSP